MYGEPQIPMTPVTHHQLGVLELTLDSSVFHLPRQFFSMLTLPALQKLSYDDKSDFGSSFQSDTITSFFRRSGCRLLELRVERVETLYQEDEFIHLLERIPSLRELSLAPRSDSTPYLVDILQHLSETPTAGDFLPELRSLEYISQFPIPWEPIAECFGPTENFHSGHRRPLKTVKLIHDFEYDEYQELRPYSMSTKTVRRVYDILIAGFDIQYSEIFGRNGDIDILKFAKGSLKHQSVRVGTLASQISGICFVMLMSNRFADPQAIDSILKFTRNQIGVKFLRP
ncbi:hypothetical protein CPB84DRAFT_1752506 [Gymnopilus junonius]|uniref:Uncharacterized protein n=1 Tax=Gymnopilus junonius TaxID=109634 RepID=A0A9P5TH98_GYMJU|nr:hypothetical protein CPB84DRAFT_1752506 [Gymnopilus junonius]